ncbi:MAG: pyridoxamine 5'-phosphate oxidase family protein [Saccharofermentanales bacterium]
MRRKDREISEMDRILDIIKKCDVCSLAFFDEGYPYIVPLNFGAAVEEGRLTLYFHGADAGTKMALLDKDRRVGFEMHRTGRLILSDNACKSTMDYESVCGNGLAERVEGSAKVQALQVLMRQYTGEAVHGFDAEEVRGVCVFRVVADEVHGKMKITG